MCTEKFNKSCLVVTNWGEVLRGARRYDWEYMPHWILDSSGVLMTPAPWINCENVFEDIMDADFRASEISISKTGMVTGRCLPPDLVKLIKGD